MKCKPTEIQTKYFSFLLKHFKKILKNVKSNSISEMLTQNSIFNFVNNVDQDQDKMVQINETIPIQTKGLMRREGF